MLFNSFAYMIFLPVVVALFWASPRKLRTPLLLLASYVFYMSWKPIYGLLIFGLTLGNYLFGLAMERWPERRRTLMWSAVAANLITLGIFKYTYFAWDVANAAMSPLGKSLPPLALEIILPLGISFFVFEFIHYIVDVYRGGKVVRSFVEFALFASFFPTQIAGPIKRYQDFIPQLTNDHKFEWKYFDEGISLILFGLFKKVLFADNLAVVVQSAFSRPDLLSGVDMWLAVYAFAFQIYFDFSGYTDIARGSALLLGYKVPPNFNLPYLAGSIQDFWHRWHISLSTWLRDYLFIPLGGSRGSKLFTYRNLFITMALGGLWHGASMHFLVWGMYQGVLLIAHKQLKLATDAIPAVANFRETRLFKVFSILLTFHCVCIGWVFFRAETMPIALDIIKRLLFFPEVHTAIASVPRFGLSIVNVADPVVFLLLPFIVALLFVGQLLSGWLASRERPLELPVGLKAFSLAVIACLLVVFSPDASPKFIYFQF